MNTATLIGRRVRLATGVHLGDYQPGDEGTVIHGPNAFAGDRGCYLVRMDRDGPDGPSVLLAKEEIEPVA